VLGAGGHKSDYISHIIYLLYIYQTYEIFPTKLVNVLKMFNNILLPYLLKLLYITQVFIFLITHKL